MVTVQSAPEVRKKNIHGCIFDLDGTLLYTLQSMAVPANRMLQELSLKEQPVENYRYYCGDGADNLVRRVLAASGDPEAKLFDQAYPLYMKYFNDDPMLGVTRFPGIGETLEQMKQMGIGLAVCSNKPDEAAGRVIADMFPGIFTTVIGQSDAIRRKPAPDTPLMAAARLGVTPGECMYVGDSGTDMRTGKAAGMFTVGVLWGYRDLQELQENGADETIREPADLLRFLTIEKQ